MALLVSQPGMQSQSQAQALTRLSHALPSPPSLPGTTLVHNLLALDPRFAYARTLDAGFPSACLWMSRFAWALAGFCDSTRPMDALPLSLDTP